MATDPMAKEPYSFAISEWGYDVGTKVWTFVFGIVLAAVIDYCYVIMPVRNHPPHDPHMRGWTIALIIAMLAPAGWISGSAVKKNWTGVATWTIATAFAVVFQLVVINWANNYS